MCKKIQSLKPISILFLIISTIILLVYSLGYDKAIFFIKYFSYLYSTFSLVIVILNIKRFYLYLKNKIINTKIFNKIKKLLYKNKIIKKYFEDIKFKVFINLLLSTTINSIFILINFINGVNNNSLWFISLAIYYLLLTIIKVILLSNLKKYEKDKEIKVYALVGYFIMFINIALVIIIIQMITSNIFIVYDNYAIYIVATYTFYLIISAVFDVFRYKKYHNLMLSSVKVINLLTASVSILMLQVAMITKFGNGQEDFMRLMNILTGTGVSIIILGVSTYMIIKAKKFENNIINR